jgi:hypothetical protein
VAVLAKSHTERHTATALGQSFVKRFLIVGHAFDPIKRYLGECHMRCT